MRPIHMTSAISLAFLSLCFTFVGCSQGVGGKSGPIKLPNNPKAGDKLVLHVNGAKMTFRYCPPGEFTMNVFDLSDKYLPDVEEDEEGDADVPKKPVRVKITRGFWIQETELTRDQAAAISKKEEYSRKDYEDGTPSNSGDYPFWGSRHAFDEILKELNADEKVLADDMTPRHRITPEGWKFELPTEAEWEYASRAGTNDPEPDDESDKYAWSKENSKEVVQKVASKKANKWGLYDMRGNVWERVRVPQDNTKTDMPDQQIFDEDGALRDPDNLRGRFEVVKGGGIGMTAKDCKSETWSYLEEEGWSMRSFQGDVGGRLVLVEEASILKPDRKQIVRETGFERWRREQREESQKHFEEFRKTLEERRKRDEEELEAARKANPDAFKTPEQEVREELERVRRESEEEQAATNRREIENVMSDQGMTEEQAKEFLAQRKADAQKADEAFDKEHGLDSIADPVERSRRRMELRREEIEKKRQEMFKSNPQMAELQKQAEERRKKFEERREESRKKFEERRQQRQKEAEERMQEFENQIDEMMKKTGR